MKAINLVTTTTEIHKNDNLNKALDLLESKLGDLKDKPLLPAPLLNLAKDIHNIENNLGLDVAVSNPQALKTIQKILGGEGEVRKPRADDVEKGWRYKYGPWEFRAVDGSVKYVLLYCSVPRKK